MFSEAKSYYERGLNVIPLEPNGKRPAVKEWRHWQTKRQTLGDIANLFGHMAGNVNVGLLTGEVNGLCVLDMESREAAARAWKELDAATYTIQRTRRGLHLFFRHPGFPVPNGVKVNGFYDIRGDGGYVVCPPSTIAGHTYHWLEGFALGDPNDLPPFRKEWLPEKAKNGHPKSEDELFSRIARARLYVEKIEGAVSGQNGHGTTFRVACKLIHEFGLSCDQAFPIMLEFNSRCSPPWKERELLHKLQDAQKTKDAI